MLRLITYSQQTTQEIMSFNHLLRRLIDYSRFILRNHQILLGRRKLDVLPENTKGVSGGGLRIAEGRRICNIVGGGGNGAAAAGAGRASSSSSPASIVVGASSTSTLSRIGTHIQTQVRQLFINNVLRRATTNPEVARQAAQRLLYGDSRPFFALVGVSLATGSVGVVSQDSEFDGICWEIRESISRQSKENATTNSTITDDPDIVISSVSDLKFGPILNQGCNAAVYAANYKDSTETEWNMAVKMMFNYDIASDAFAILRGMVKEIVPARHVDLKNLFDLDKSLFDNVKRCPPHNNVINIHHAFVDKIPLLPEGLENYPSALPRRLNPDDGLGRNMSLFLVMKRYDANLQEYLKNTELTFRTRLLILTQILSGVAHLENNQIAHRDLKTDNILVDMSQGYMFPEIVISDFGCCLADKTHGLSFPFRTYDTDRGGNAALTAPEISTSVPGAWKYLNYNKSDAWTVGAIAYEIFGNQNPFYGPSGTRLDSRTYSDEDLPPVNNANPTVEKLIKCLLKRNPSQRISAEKAFNICILLLWAPSDWALRSGGRYPNDDDILQWLVCLTAKALCQTNEQLEFKLMRTFLRRVKFSSLKSAVIWVAQSRDE